MQISKYDSRLLHSCMYVIQEEDHALVIDPCKNTAPAEKLKVDMLIVTHEHYDHISGVNEWKEVTGAPLLCSQACAENIRNSKKNMSRFFDVFCALQTWIPMDGAQVETEEYTCQADRTFQDSMEFLWMGHQIRLIEIPGHSKGSIGIYLDEKDFFSGDSLLENMQIELRLPGGNSRDWEKIGKERIAAVPKGTRIWPGHFENFVI